jgi:MFS family permease
MLYLISFIEAFCNGLISVNLVLYLKYVLNFTELNAGVFITAYGIISSALIFLLGPAIDKYGSKKCAIAGSSLLILSRIGLGLNTTVIGALILFLLVALGSATKSSSITVLLKQQNKSFKFDYLIFNSAYFLAGILFDELKDYRFVYLLAGIINIANLFCLFTLKATEPSKDKDKTPINWSTLRTVLIYNSMLLAVNCIFIWMHSGLPKWVMQVLGPDAPVGKIYGSLNPFIILVTIPIVMFLQKRFSKSVYYLVLLGSLISALSMFLITLPLSYFHSLIAVIVMFTIGEAIWSPANMEMSAKLCPEGQEGKYMTLALIPAMISRTIMGGVITFSLTQCVFSPVKHYSMPFIIIGSIALLTPVGLFLLNKFTNALNVIK